MTTVVGLLTVQLELPAFSLKDKRQTLKSVQARLRQQFNISVAEVDQHDHWQSAVLAVACVSGSQAYAHGLLMKVVNWIETTRLDCTLVDYQLEFW